MLKSPQNGLIGQICTIDNAASNNLISSQHDMETYLDKKWHLYEYHQHCNEQ